MIQLKYQFRQGLFLIPIIVIPLDLLFKTYFLAFFLLQNRFFNVFQQADFHLLQVHISGSKLKYILKQYNLSWAIWFNLWFFVDLAIQIFWFETPFHLYLGELINFNALLFMSFIIGNMLSNSDLITIKNNFLRYLGLSFIFSFSISLVYSACLFINSFHNSFWYSTFLLIVIVQLWHYTTLKQNRIKYINYYL